MQHRAAYACVVFGLAVVSGAACGKKGPPLAPLVPIPAPVATIEANRLGNDVYVTLTLPAANIDEYTPADLDRVEVYGYTGRGAPPRARWVELSTLVATVPVAPPPPKPGDTRATPQADSKPSSAPLQGQSITIRDILTPDELAQGKEPAPIRDTRSADRDPELAAPDPEAAARAGRAAELPLNRYYTAVPFNSRGRPGPPGGVAEFPLVRTPAAPPSVTARYTDREILLEWEPSGGLIGFLLERVLLEEPLPFDDPRADAAESTEPSGPLLYHVYREVLPDTATPPGPPAASWREEPPTPVTPIPLPTLDFIDTLEFERRRCYTVRAVRGVGTTAPLGDASPQACFTPVDVFPPAPPNSLATVASEGAISLIWEPNTELDLGGYIVLRGEAAGDTLQPPALQPLTDAPVAEPAYRDATVKPGVRYVYAVIAVDNRLPLPNMSGESARMEETAR